MNKYLLLLFLSAAAAGKILPSELTHGGLYQEYESYTLPQLDEMGKELLKRNSLDSALVLYTVMANVDCSGKKQGNRHYAIQGRSCLGVINFLKSNYREAYRHFYESIQLDNVPDSPGYINLASIYLYYGDREKAAKCLMDVFRYAVKAGHDYHASATLINILTADPSGPLVPPDTLRSIINEFDARIKKSAKNPAYELAHNLCRATLLSLDNRHEESIMSLKKLVHSADSMLMPERNIFASYFGIGREYESLGKPDSALRYMLDAEKIAFDNGYSEFLVESYKSIGDLYSKMGDTEKAMDYRLRHLELSDSLFNTREFGKVRDLELLYEADKYEKRINAITLQKRMRQNLLVAAVVVGLVLFVLLLYILRQNRILNRKNKSLFERNMEIMANERLSGHSTGRKAEDVEPAAPDNPVADNGETDGQEEKYQSSSLTEDSRHLIKECIDKVMDNEKYFCSQSFSLNELARMCGTNTKYVSQIINEDMGMSFSQLLNEKRVFEARRRLSDFERYGNMTIEAIVSDLGVKSRSTFTKTFKRITGLTPSEFQKLAKEQVDNR